MNKVRFLVWIVVTIIVCVGSGWGIYIWQAGVRSGKSSSEAQTSSLDNHSGPNSPVVTRVIPREAASEPNQSMWHDYALARQKALQEDPELAAEYKQVQAEVDRQRKKLEAGIIRIDPKTAPIIAKYHAMREQPVSHAASLHPGMASSSAVTAITPAEWQELRSARDASLKRNPNLVEAGKPLDQKLRDFQRKIDVAVLKIDPSVAPIVALLEDIPGPAQTSTAPPPPPIAPVSHPNAPPPRRAANQ